MSLADETQAIEDCVAALSDLSSTSQKKVIAYLQSHADETYAEEVREEADAINEAAQARDAAIEEKRVAEEAEAAARTELTEAHAKIAELENPPEQIDLDQILERGAEPQLVPESSPEFVPVDS